MNEENLVYKQIDNRYHFCYYSFGKMIKDDDDRYPTLYTFEYNQGEVGELNDFDCELDEDIVVLEKLRDQVIETYNIKQIPLKKIELTVLLNDLFIRLSKKEQLFLINHVSRAIDYVSKCAGLGINNFVAPKNKVVLESGIYKTVLSVHGIRSFKKLFIEHITPCGVKEDQVTFIDV